jgi:hypothetical protein
MSILEESVVEVEAIDIDINAHPASNEVNTKRTASGAVRHPEGNASGGVDNSILRLPFRCK